MRQERVRDRRDEFQCGLGHAWWIHVLQTMTIPEDSGIQEVQPELIHMTSCPTCGIDCLWLTDSDASTHVEGTPR